LHGFIGIELAPHRTEDPATNRRIDLLENCPSDRVRIEVVGVGGCEEIRFALHPRNHRLDLVSRVAQVGCQHLDIEAGDRPHFRLRIKATVAWH
jgi:hypothetical protein